MQRVRRATVTVTLLQCGLSCAAAPQKSPISRSSSGSSGGSSSTSGKDRPSKRFKNAAFSSTCRKSSIFSSNPLFSVFSPKPLPQPVSPSHHAAPPHHLARALLLRPECHLQRESPSQSPPSHPASFIPRAIIARPAHRHALQPRPRPLPALQEAALAARVGRCAPSARRRQVSGCVAGEREDGRDRGRLQG